MRNLPGAAASIISPVQCVHPCIQQRACILLQASAAGSAVTAASAPAPSRLPARLQTRCIMFSFIRSKHSTHVGLAD